MALRADTAVRETAPTEGPDGDREPPIDPDAIGRAYRRHRAKRKARVEHRRSTARAGRRFWLSMLVLVAVCIVLVITVRHEIQQLFGL
jgi:hypothetical protein